MATSKIKVTEANIVVRGTKEKPYFVIVYHEVGKPYNNEGYGSYMLDNVLRWREQYMELVCENEDAKENGCGGRRLLECKVCGTKFGATLERKYIARDSESAGLAVLAKTAETSWYDAFDCPVCGCQIIAQERKRSVGSLYDEVGCNCEECADGVD